jgi:hypothetical protein
LFSALQDNYVICEVRVDVKNKTMPFGAPFFRESYTLMSMYQAMLTKESVNL